MYTCLCACACLVTSNSEIPRTVAHQVPLSTGSSRQEYWSGFRFPPPGDLPDPCISCIGRWIVYQQHHLGRPKKCEHKALAGN